MKGTIFDISHYMIEDGPGIRTNVFLKGCYLSCKWCSNAYGLSPKLQMGYRPQKCTGCRHCVDVCPQQAISVNPLTGQSHTNWSKCTHCLSCIKCCPATAREQIGRQMTASEIVREVQKDQVFYRRGNGGVTISGGEILMQPEFVIELLKACQEAYLNTAIETSGFGRWEDLSACIAYADTVFIDCKCMDAQQHQQLTGVENGLILNNIRQAAVLCKQLQKRLILRFPLIPGHNDDTDNIQATARFVASLPGTPLLNVLPYHNYGMHRYEIIGKSYELESLKPHTKEALQEIEHQLRQFQVPFSIGGYNIDY